MWKNGTRPLRPCLHRLPLGHRARDRRPYRARGLDGRPDLLRSLVPPIPSPSIRRSGSWCSPWRSPSSGWRFADRGPGFGPEVRPYERAGATAMHWLLNALMILVPVTGYAISTSEDAGIDMFGLFELPALLRKNGEAPRPRHRPAFLSGLWRHRPGRHTCRRRAQASFRRQGLDAETHAEPAAAYRAARLKPRARRCHPATLNRRRTKDRSPPPPSPR